MDELTNVPTSTGTSAPIDLATRLNSALGDYPAHVDNDRMLADTPAAVADGSVHGDERRKGGGPGRFRGARKYGPRAPYTKSPYSVQHRTPISNRVYVGNLPYQTSWQDLKDHMRQAGNVVHADVLVDDQGRSKGCGIIEYSTPEEAQTAIKTLSDSKLPNTDRPIFVREDREERAYTRGTGYARDRAGGGGIASARKAPTQSFKGRQIFVGNLPYTTSWQDLKDAFRRCGNVIRADVLLGIDGSSKGQGTVLFESRQDALRAIQMLDNTEFQGRVITVHEDRFA